MDRRRAQAPSHLLIPTDMTFDQRLYHHIANCLRAGEGCSVFMLRVLNLPERPQEPACALSMTERLNEVARRIRMVVRSADPVEVDDGRAIGVVLLSADAAGAQAVRRRLTQVLERPDAGYSPVAADETLGLTLGCATQPPTREATAVPDLASALVRVADEPVVLVSAVIGEPEQPGVGNENLDSSARGKALTSSPSLARRVEAETTPPPGARARPGAPPRGEGSRAENPPSRRRAEVKRAPERLADTVARRKWPPFVTNVAGARQAWMGREDQGRDQSRALRWRAGTLGVPYVLDLAEHADGCFPVIGPALARELGAVPIGRERGILTVAMRDPGDADAMLRLRVASGMRIFPVLVDQAVLDRALDALERTVANAGPTGL